MENSIQVLLSKKAEKFLKDELSKEEREKVVENLNRINILIDKDIFKKLTKYIWEFRTLYNGKQIRLLAFWDKRDNKNTLVIVSNGFIKKTQKTPKLEIEIAESIRKRYFVQNE
jgi:phage-related protein